MHEKTKKYLVFSVRIRLKSIFEVFENARVQKNSESEKKKKVFALSNETAVQFVFVSVGFSEPRPTL